ncbi:MAG: hypothetical protein KAS39_04955, partial [Actinomycetia bacterium]|nr:hypothetical protein [Actinomycetes bacterium]
MKLRKDNPEYLSGGQQRKMFSLSLSAAGRFFLPMRAAFFSFLILITSMISLNPLYGYIEIGPKFLLLTKPA